MGLSGRAQMKAILQVLEVQPRIVAIVDCPWCDQPEMLEMDPQDGMYWCRACGRHGPLAHLARFAEAQFLARHRDTLQLMRQPGCDKEGRR